MDIRLPNEQAVLARMRGTQDRIADAITTFAGTMQFVYLHAVWFTVWITFNEGLFGRSAIWDPYPFGLLTMIVSLEAIFLSTFVMVSQNRQAIREKVRADLDFETNIRSEVWAAHMGHALGVDAEEVEQDVRTLLAQNRAKMNDTEQIPTANQPID
ncbi:DUF1003 domain-containing protein [Streptomyces sp. NPDC048504]|uniref:DUF1003 domain-containing protein n=1 Tax=Streptomyces sp. NPDC048504 TaxID=3365559 RepID=UPI003714CE48